MSIIFLNTFFLTKQDYNLQTKQPTNLMHCNASPEDNPKISTQKVNLVIYAPKNPYTYSNQTKVIVISHFPMKVQTRT